MNEQAAQFAAEIKVINNLTFTLRGRYNGEDFVFPPGKPVVLPMDAAKHIFGLGAKDKSQALNMLGFLIPGRDTVADALAKLDKIAFVQGKTVFDDDRPAAKTGERPHVEGPGGEQGARVSFTAARAPANPGGA